MDSDIAQLWEENVFVSEATALQKAIGDITKLPRKSIKFGKYKLLADSYVFETTYADAVGNGYISTPTQRNLEQFIALGFIFTEVIFGWKMVTASRWVPAPGTPSGMTIATTTESGNLSTLVYGATPDNQKFVYVRKGGQQIPPMFYFEKTKAAAGEVFKKYDTGALKPTLANILDASVHGKWKIEADGGCVVDGDIRINERNRFRFIEITLDDIPVKLKKVTGTCYVRLTSYDMSKLPEEVGELNIAPPQDATDLTLLPTKTFTANILTIALEPNHKLESFKGIPNMVFDYVTIQINGGKYVNSFEGLPEKVNNLNLNGFAGHINTFKGMPIVLGDLEFGRVEINSLDDFTHVNGNLSMYGTIVTNNTLLRGGIGSKVDGEILIAGIEGLKVKKSIHSRVDYLDKKHYTKDYLDAIDQGSQAAGANLDF